MKRTTILRWAAGILVLALVGIAAFWAGRTTLAPADSTVQRPSSDSTVTVEEHELGREITVGTAVKREQTPAATNLLDGVVTQASTSGEFAAGDVLYAVAQRPVVLVTGSMPMWRPLTEGASGDDVTAFQEMLAADQRGLKVSGTWDAATAQAWKAWLADRGYPEADTVELGQLVMVEESPVSLAIDTQSGSVGTQLTGGETVVSMPSSDPAFVIEASSQEQAALIPAGTLVTVPYGEHTWKAIAGEASQADDGPVEIPLTSPDGGVVCADRCADLPADKSTSLLSRVSVVPPQSGPVVPVSALRAQPDGRTVVTVVEDGMDEEREVTVKTSADGLAVVEGVEAGERVRVLNEAP